MLIRKTIPCHSVLAFFFLLLMIVGVTFPSDGSHGLLSPKSLAFLGTMGSLGLYILVRQQFTLTQLKIFGFMISALAFLLAWLFISVAYGETSTNGAFDQFKIFLLTLCVVIVAMYVVSEQIVTFQKLLKTLIYANFTYSVAKILLIILHLLSVINMWGIIDALGIRFMSMNIIGAMPRFQTSIDISTPFLLFFFLQGEKIGVHWSRTFKILYMTFSLFAIFLSFSRFLMFIGFVSILFHILSLEVKKVVRGICILLLVMLGGATIIGFENVAIMVERRLFSDDNYVSDQVRGQQIAALMEENEEYPILGKGLGGYAKSSVRDTMIAHSYEVQWIAFFMQFGFIGILFLVFPIGIISSKILSTPWSRSKIGLFILFLGWLAAGFTNPFLISLQSGILYSLFLLMGQELTLEGNA